jgi:hypothetical protein
MFLIIVMRTPLGGALLYVDAAPCPRSHGPEVLFRAGEVARCNRGCAATSRMYSGPIAPRDPAEQRRVLSRASLSATKSCTCGRCTCGRSECNPGIRCRRIHRQCPASPRRTGRRRNTPSGKCSRCRRRRREPGTPLRWPRSQRTCRRRSPDCSSRIACHRNRRPRREDRPCTRRCPGSTRCNSMGRRGYPG